MYHQIYFKIVAILMFFSVLLSPAQQFSYNYTGNDGAYQFYIKTMGFKGYMMTKAWLPISKTKVNTYDFDVEWIQVQKDQTKNTVLINYKMLEKNAVVTIKEIKLLNKDNSATKLLSPQNGAYKEIYDLIKKTFADDYFRIADEFNFYSIK